MALIKDFIIAEKRAVIVKHDTLGHLCGYIGIPEGHPLHGKHYDDEAVPHEVHGGWTYSEDHAPFVEADGRWYFGFDCAHLGDYVPGASFSDPDNSEDTYRDESFVERELRQAATTF